MKCSERGVVINFSSVTKKIDPSTGAMRPLTSAKQRCSLLLFLAQILSHRLVSQALAQHQWAHSVWFCHFCFKHPNTKKWLLWCPQGNQLQSKSLKDEAPVPLPTVWLLFIFSISCFLFLFFYPPYHALSIFVSFFLCPCQIHGVLVFIVVITIKITVIVNNNG